MSQVASNDQAAVGRAHSTPDPETPPTQPNPPAPPLTPDDVPEPAHAPVEEPRRPEPPIVAG